MKVDIEKVRELKRQLDEINSVPIEDIEFFENGKRVEFDKDVVADWKFIGLNNVDFITSGFYKGEVASHKDKIKSGIDDSGNPYIDLSDPTTAAAFMKKTESYKKIKTV